MQSALVGSWVDDKSLLPERSGEQDRYALLKAGGHSESRSTACPCQYSPASAWSTSLVGVLGRTLSSACVGEEQKAPQQA